MVEGDPASTDETWKDRGITTDQDIENALLNETNGFSDQAAYDDSQLFHNTSQYDAAGGETRNVAGMEITYSGDGDWHDTSINDGTNNPAASDGSSTRMERIVIEETTEPLFLAVVGSGQYDMMVDWETMPAGPPPHPTSTPTDIVMGAGFGETADTLTIDPTPADSRTLELNTVNLTTQQGASSALGVFDEALGQINDHRAYYGAMTNRFDGAIDNLAQQSLNTSAAQSRIQDADYAAEVAELTKAQILQKAGTSVLAQANQLPQNALSLLG